MEDVGFACIREVGFQVGADLGYGGCGHAEHCDTDFGFRGCFLLRPILLVEPILGVSVRAIRLGGMKLIMV